MIFLPLAVASRLFAAASIPLDSNLLQEPGFESGLTRWSFWARSPDSGRAVPGTACRTGAGCAEIAHEGSQDWAYSPSANTVAVHTGELWRWQAWVRCERLDGSSELGFVTTDSAAQTLEWLASPAYIQVDSGWKLVVAHLAVPRNCQGLRPRLTGNGPVKLTIDDAFFAREADPPASTILELSNDSLHLWIDPVDLSMKLSDPGSADTLALAGLAPFRLDSSRRIADTLVLSVHHIADLWPARIRASLPGGSLRLELTADSMSKVSDEFQFPATIPTRAGQRIALPRGTGLSWPVDGPLSSRWSLKSVPFWDWQVSQAVTGSTDGKTGFVVSVAYPEDAKVVVDKSGSQPSRPEIWQLPSKGVFGHARSATIAPLRGGGFAEMARRHRASLEKQGRVKDWTRKIAENPNVEKLRGAVDWWMQGSGFAWKAFDTLRWMGLEKAVVHWNWASKSAIDSLVARGWLMSVYDDWADAFPGDTSLFGREHPEGAIVQADGSPLKGWLEIHADGSTRQALEICAARHPALARAVMHAERASTSRNARFVDVELAIQPQECWSGVHPTDRRTDLAFRHQALSIVKDTFRTVTGSEQTRDLFHDVVDYGEGSMSIASVADAGYHWETLEAPEPTMDSLSMDPALRIPLLPLTDHDAFSPTWYTGDGQSKVPLRWDDKDAWNMLYATMPLIMPADRGMWDSLRTRYLRSINVLEPFLERCQFSSMTDWEAVSTDRKVQRTRFGNGWTVVANFDAVMRDEAGTSLPPKGYLASGPGERIERTFLDGAVRSRVRTENRWFVDPEGSSTTLDGVRTSGQVLLVRESDSILALAILGGQNGIELDPRHLPWPSPGLTASTRSGQEVPLADAGGGWLGLSTTGQGRFFRLHGAFGAFTGIAPTNPRLLSARVFATARGWELRWNQTSDAPAVITLIDLRGKVLHRDPVAGRRGQNSTFLPHTSALAWVRVETRGESKFVTLFH